MVADSTQRSVAHDSFRRSVSVRGLGGASFVLALLPVTTMAAQEKLDEHVATEPELTEAEEERLEERLENENIVGYEVQERERVNGPGGTQAHEERHFDDGVYFYLVPGGLNVPYDGQDGIDYEDTFDPGYQWGLGLGFFVRSKSRFAIGIGGYFDHAIVNLESRDIDSGDFRHQFRLGLELKPGAVFGDRVFVYVPIRGGYVADVRDFDDDLEAHHGPMFGIGGGLDISITDTFYVGTALGTDLQFFRSDRDFEMYSFVWRVLLGWRFGDDGDRR